MSHQSGGVTHKPETLREMSNTEKNNDTQRKENRLSSTVPQEPSQMGHEIGEKILEVPLQVSWGLGSSMTGKLTPSDNRLSTLPSCSFDKKVALLWKKVGVFEEENKKEELRKLLNKPIKCGNDPMSQQTHPHLCGILRRPGRPLLRPKMRSDLSQANPGPKGP